MRNLRGAKLCTVLRRWALKIQKKAVEIAFQVARDRDMSNVIIASTWGNTAREALKHLDGGQFNLVVVTHNTGFKTPGIQEFEPEVKTAVEKAGGKVLTATMPTRTLGRAIKNKLGFSQEDIACAAWRMFCQGAKVCVEISGMAADAGLVAPGPAVVVAGTGKGADTVMIIDVLPSNETFNMKIREIVAKPVNF